MENSHSKFQVAKMLLIALLLLITPLLSTSMRPPYVYFLLNLLIIAVGADAGLLSFLKPQDEYQKKSPALVVTPPKALPLVTTTTPNKEATTSDHDHYKSISTTATKHEETPKLTTTHVKKKAVDKSASEKIMKVVKAQVVKRCPSTPSLFFIGGGDNYVEAALDDQKNMKIEEHEEEEQEEHEALSGQELYTKAETFIGNFYKQLKIQREDSWKKIHGAIYHRAF